MLRKASSRSAVTAVTVVSPNFPLETDVHVEHHAQNSIVAQQ